jgi:hypothetical protein
MTFSLLNMLQAEHCDILGILHDLMNAPPQSRPRLARDLRYVVVQHVTVEEKYLYPLLRKDLDAAEQWAAEHAQILISLQMLLQVDCGGVSDTIINEIHQQLEIHFMREEEAVLRPNRNLQRGQWLLVESCQRPTTLSGDGDM